MVAVTRLTLWVDAKGVATTTAGLDSVAKSVLRVNQSVANAGKALNRFMGLGFSMLFMGMALKRVFTGFWRSTFNTMKLVSDETSVFNQKTQELSAAWEFFKFALIDALMQSPLFITMIDNVIAFVNWLGRLQPKTLVIIGLALAFGVVATTVAMLLGQLILLGIGLNSATGGAVITGLAYLAVLFNIIWINILIATKAAWAFTAALFANPITWLITGVVVLIAFLILLTKKFGSIGNAFKIMGITFLMVLAVIADAIVRLLVTPLQWVAVGILWAIYLFDKLAGTNFYDSAAGKGLQKFIDFEPNITGFAAEKLAPYTPDVADGGSTKETMGSFLEDLKGIFNTIPDKIAEGVANQPSTTK